MAENRFVDLKKVIRNLFIFITTLKMEEKTKRPIGRIAVFSKVEQGVIVYISTK